MCVCVCVCMYERVWVRCVGVGEVWERVCVFMYVCVYASF